MEWKRKHGIKEGHRVGFLEDFREVDKLMKILMNCVEFVCIVDVIMFGRVLVDIIHWIKIC
jgi:citrate lyase alpha subunit